ncbi:lysoplasmalogenase [Sesbania bispinosa]|nr:lysoplasmalogenase [Sesbania bispinosa]
MGRWSVHTLFFAMEWTLSLAVAHDVPTLFYLCHATLPHRCNLHCIDILRDKDVTISFRDFFSLKYDKWASFAIIQSRLVSCYMWPIKLVFEINTSHNPV